MGLYMSILKLVNSVGYLICVICLQGREYGWASRRIEGRLCRVTCVMIECHLCHDRMSPVYKCHQCISVTCVT